MQEYTYRFFALGSDCVLSLFAAENAVAHETAAAASREIARIEARYSRYSPKSELARINAAGKVGGGVEVDAETAGLIDYAYACYRKSDGLFDITSGLLRKAWEFSSNRLPGQEAIAELLPRIGLDKVEWRSPRLAFVIPGMELDLGGIGKRPLECDLNLCLVGDLATSLADFTIIISELKLSVRARSRMALT